jgi:CDP-glycerol glycerophosphotransferase
MFSRAAKISVLTDIVYDYRAREDRSSVSQRPEDISDLRDRVLAWRLTLEALRAESPEDVVQGWYETVYNTHLHWYLNSESISDPEYWAILVDAFRFLEMSEPEGLMERVSPEKRVAVELLRAGRQDAMVAFRDAGGYELEATATTSTPGGLQHHLPVPTDVLPTLPPGTLVSRPAQLELRQEVTGGRWLESAEGLRLELTGFAHIAYLDAGEPERVELFATNPRTGSVISADVTGTGPGSGEPTGYRAVFKVDELCQGAEAHSWELGVRVTARHFTVAEPLRSLSARAGLMEAPVHLVDEGRVLRLASNPNRHVPLRLVLNEPDVIADTISVRERTATITLRARRGIRPAHLILTSPGRPRISTPLHSRNGVWRAQVAIPEHTVDAFRTPIRRTWEVRVEDRIGRARRLTWTEDAGRALDVGEGLLRASSTPSGDLTFEEFPLGFIVLTGLDFNHGGKLEATGVVHPAPGLRDYRLAAGDSEGPITTETMIHGNLIEFSATGGTATEGSVVTVTGSARDVHSEAFRVPVLVSRSIVTTLPMAAPDSSLAAERGRERTLRLRLTPAAEGTSA